MILGDLANFAQLDAETEFAGSKRIQKLHNWVSQSFRLEKGAIVKNDASAQYTITDLGNGDTERFFPIIRSQFIRQKILTV